MQSDLKLPVVLSDMADDHPVAIAPAPWTLQADSWVFPFWSSMKSPSLAPGSYHPMENVEVGNFKGGPGAWLLYRYSDSPVGEQQFDDTTSGVDTEEDKLTTLCPSASPCWHHLLYSQVLMMR